MATETFAPVPYDVGPADSDCAVLIWHRERKSLVLYLSCYGSVDVRVGLMKPPGGSAYMLTFEEAFQWWCSDSLELPPDVGRLMADGTRKI